MEGDDKIVKTILHDSSEENSVTSNLVFITNSYGFVFYDNKNFTSL